MQDYGIGGNRLLATTGAAIAVAAAAWPAAGATEPTLGPGDRIGAMTLAQLGFADTIPSIFPSCDPLIRAPGLYHRHCSVPSTRRLFVGWGTFKATFPALERVWQRERWRLRVDGHEIRLGAFGTDDRTLYNYPLGAYRNSILREWRVALLHPSRGRHLIRYVVRDGSEVTDVTFTVRIR